MQVQKNEYQKQLTRELYIFTTIGMVAGSVYGLYYGIFLYRNSFDLKVLVIDTLLVAISSWVGYICGVFYIHKSGYLKALRLSFFLLFVVSLITLLVIPAIRTVYPLLSIMRGIPLGIGAAVIDTFLLKEFASASRSRFFNINLSIEFIIAVVLPVIIGGIITYLDGYRLTFMLAALVYLAALLVPIHYNKRPKSLTSLSDELHMIKKKGIKEFNLNTAVTAGADELNVLLIAIVPFLLLKSEFKVGVVTSAVAIFAAITAFLARDLSYGRQIRLGYFGNSGRLVSNFLLAIVWTPWAVIFQGLVNKGLAAFNDPVFRRLRLSSAEGVLGTDLNKEALELNLVTATMSLIGQIIALSTFLVILSLSNETQILALRYLLVAYGVWKVINYIWVLNMKRRFSRFGSKIEKADQVPAV
jgi:hypothetical protein